MHFKRNHKSSMNCNLSPFVHFFISPPPSSFLIGGTEKKRKDNNNVVHLRNLLSQCQVLRILNFWLLAWNVYFSICFFRKRRQIKLLNTQLSFFSYCFNLSLLLYSFDRQIYRCTKTVYLKYCRTLEIISKHYIFSGIVFRRYLKTALV